MKVSEYEQYESESGVGRHVRERYPELWAIVSSPEACVLMREMAMDERHLPAKQRRPAVEALVEIPTFVRLNDLVRRHDNDTYNTFHQEVGRICKVIMCHLGFEEHKTDVSTRNQRIFQSGSVYRLKPVYI